MDRLNRQEKLPETVVLKGASFYAGSCFWNTAAFCLKPRGSILHVGLQSNVKFCVTILFASIVSTCFSQASPSKSAGKCSIQGQVVQAPEGQPIKKVKLELQGWNERGGISFGSSFSATSDSEGRFKFEDLNPGRYQIRPARSGFVDTSRRWGGKLVILKPEEELKGVVVRMQRAAVITGKILDRDGDPMPGVSVWVRPDPSRPKRHEPRLVGFRGFGSTNDLGEYRIFGLRPGRYLLSGEVPTRQAGSSANGTGTKQDPIYATTYYPGTVDKNQAVPIELHPGDEVPLTFALAPVQGFRVRGTMTPMPPGSHAWITLRSNSQGFSSYMPETISTDGKFEFSSVLPGSYSATAMILRIGDEQGTSVVQPVEVVDADVSDVRIDLVPGGLVRGRIRTDRVEGLDWSQFSVRMEPVVERDSADRVVVLPDQRRSVQVKKDGTFLIENVAAGTYRAVLNAGGSSFASYFVKAVNLDGKDVRDTGFSVRGGTYILDVVYSGNGATIEGQVVDDADQPVAYSKIVCIATDEQRNPVHTEDADDHGRFHIRGLAPGEYTIFAALEFEDDFRDPEFLKSHAARVQTVGLSEGDRKSVPLKLMPSSEDNP